MTGLGVHRAPALRLARCGAQGTTMLETVVALAILAVFLSLSVSGRSLIDNRRLAGAARDLGTDVRWVEQRARTERRCWRVEFAPGTDAYAIHVLIAGDWTPTGGCGGGTWTIFRAVSLPPAVDLVSTTFGGNLMTTSPFGNPNGGTIVLRSRGGEERRITVNVGGRVTSTP